MWLDQILDEQNKCLIENCQLNCEYLSNRVERIQ